MSIPIQKLKLFQKTRARYQKKQDYYYPLSKYYYLSPLIVLQYFPDFLTSYEKAEIRFYPDVYYFGEMAIFKRTTPFENAAGEFQTTVFDHIAYRYEVWNFIGSGNYASVIEAYDHKHKEFVAIKMIKRKKYRYYDAKGEVTILKMLEIYAKNDDNIKKYCVELKKVFYFRGHLFIVFEKLGKNLYEFFKTLRYVVFKLDLIVHVIFNLVNSIKALNNHNLLHGDIKPENLMLTPNKTAIKLGDFGLSCSLDQLNSFRPFQSLHYCAPETILHGPITAAIDMWSIGCMVAEFYSGEILFKGEDKSDQLSCMMELLGPPTPELLIQCDLQYLKKYFHSNGYPKYCTIVTTSNGFHLKEKSSPDADGRKLPGYKTWAEALKTKNVNGDLVDFIKKCLDWDPNTRLSATDALKHPFLQNYDITSSLTNYIPK